MPDVGSSEGVDESALYAVVPEEFIAARTALVKRLRSTGNKADKADKADKAEAARVAKLRRPPLTAWALNQVARTAPELIDQLLVAGGGLRTAMEQALGGDASGLRQARAEERTAVDDIVAAAVDLLGRGGYSATDVMQQRMAATLRAAIVDESVADPLGRGVLDGDREAPGFGMDALSLPLAPAPASVPAADHETGRADEPRATPDPHPGGDPERAGERERERDEQRRQEVLRDAERLAALADALRQEAGQLAAEADRMAAEATAARERAGKAQRRADEAGEAAAARRANADRGP